MGRLTLGMTTTFRPDGASLGAWLVSPPGWYWYFAPEPDFQGSLPGILATTFSLVAPVGERAMNTDQYAFQYDNKDTGFN